MGSDQRSFVVSARVVVAILVLRAAGGTAQTVEPATQPAEAHAGAAREAPFELPAVALTARVPPADEVSFRQSSAAKVDQYVVQADAETDPLRKASVLLAAANHILAYDLEAACSRVILEIDGAAAEDVHGPLDRVDQLLARVGTVLDDVSGPRGENPKLAAAHAALEVLTAFSQGLRAVIDRDDSAEATRRARRAASALSTLLEESNPAVAAAAMLWQGVLRAREEDPAGALGILDSTLADPPRPAVIPALFARLLRTRLLARQGSFAAALALQAQMEDRCNFWFVSEQERDDCVRTINWFRLLTLRDWATKFPTDDGSGPAARKWCEDQARLFRDDVFQNGPLTVLRLGTAIPVIAEAPSADPSAPNRE